MKCLATFLLCLLFLMVTASGVPAEPTGVLLGFRQSVSTLDRPEAFSPEQEFRYFTVWVYSSGTEYRYARGPNLLVPRGEEFWEVGVERQNTETWVEDYPYSHPLGSATEIAYGPAWGTSGHVSKKITYVGPKGMSLMTHSNGYTEGAAHPWDNWSLETVDLDKINRAVRIQTVWGKVGGASLNKAFQDYITAHAKRAEHLETSVRETSWGLVRGPGAWTVLGMLGHGAEVFRGSHATFPIELPIHRSLSAHDKIVVGLNKLKTKIPGAMDTFQGPDEHPIVVLTTDHLHVYQTIQKTKPSLTIDLGAPSTPVMAEWASGPYVEKWTGIMMEFVGADI